MHLTASEALDLVEGKASESQNAFWTSHAKSCGDCQEQLEIWQKMYLILKHGQLESAPEYWIRKAEAIFQSPKTRGVVPTFRQVLALVTFDNFAQPALAGARGTANTRQVVLRAEGFDIHIRISGESERRRMTGQVLAVGEATFVNGAMMHLVRDGIRIESTSVDSLGEFEFQELPEGPLNLQLDLPHLTIVGALNVT